MLQAAASLELKAKLFRGFSDPARLAILEVLSHGPTGVTEIVEATGLSQPNTSNHLNCLYCCGLVQRQQVGRRVIYELAHAQVARILARANDLLDDVAPHIEACIRYGRLHAR